MRGTVFFIMMMAATAVFAAQNGADSVNAVDLTDTTQLAPVNDLTIQLDAASLNFTLTWSPVPDATGYVVFRMESTDVPYWRGDLLTPTPVHGSTYLHWYGPLDGPIAFFQVIALR